MFSINILSKTFVFLKNLTKIYFGVLLYCNYIFYVSFMVNTNNPANPDTGKNSLIALNNKKNIDTIHGLSAWRKASINFQNRVDDILSNTKMA